jgi:hypothetical protein
VVVSLLCSALVIQMKKTMNRKKYQITIYSNGFVNRQHNCRVSFLQDYERNNIWYLTFERVRRGDFTMEDKANFEMTYTKLGLTYTLKRVLLAKETMELACTGFTGYLQAVKNANLKNLMA